MSNVGDSRSVQLEQIQLQYWFDIPSDYTTLVGGGGWNVLQGGLQAQDLLVHTRRAPLKDGIIPLIRWSGTHPQAFERGVGSHKV